MESHNCIRELRTLMSAAEQKNSDLRKDLDEVKYELAEQRRDIGLLKEVIRKHNRGGAEHVQGKKLQIDQRVAGIPLHRF